MKRLVLKYGGTSDGNIEKIQKVANLIKKKHDQNIELIVVVSAMSGLTNELVKKSQSISKTFIPCRVVFYVTTYLYRLTRFYHLNFNVLHISQP